jgi:hypothetical protein
MAALILAVSLGSATHGVGGQEVPTPPAAGVPSSPVERDAPRPGVSGTIVDDETDEPIKGAEVIVTRGARNDGAEVTGKDGRFHIDLRAGEFGLRASADGYTAARLDVTVGDTNATEIRIALRRGDELRGTVLDFNGKPAPGILITARADGERGLGRTATSAVDGTFEFSSLRPGSYSLSGGSAAREFGTLSGIAPGTTGVVLQLTRGGFLRISATEGNETPVPGATVSIRRVNGTRVLLSDSPRTDDDGAVELACPAGVIEVDVRTDGLLGTGEATVRSEGLTEIEVTLSAEDPPPTP